MDDTRLQTAKNECMEALAELDNDDPNVPRVVALLDDARCGIVDVVDEALGTLGRHNRDLNGLDAARTYINRAITLLQGNGEWVFTHAQQFTGYAVDALQVVLSGNVVPINRNRRPNKPGGGAA